MPAMQAKVWAVLWRSSRGATLTVCVKCRWRVKQSTQKRTGFIASPETKNDQLLSWKAPQTPALIQTLQLCHMACFCYAVFTIRSAMKRPFHWHAYESNNASTCWEKWKQVDGQNFEFWWHLKWLNHIEVHTQNISIDVFTHRYDGDTRNEECHVCTPLCRQPATAKEWFKHKTTKRDWYQEIITCCSNNWIDLLILTFTWRRCLFYFAFFFVVVVVLRRREKAKKRTF